MKENKKKLIEALIEKPSTYEVDVVDASMLPDSLKKRKTLSFVVKPPSLEVLVKCALPLQDIPDNIKKGDKVKIEEAVKYVNEMVKMICILSWGKSSDYPEWYEPFMLKNLTAKEVFGIFYEAALKLQSDFFLNSFQVANQNPMAMNLRDSTLMR